MNRCRFPALRCPDCTLLCFARLMGMRLTTAAQDYPCRYDGLDHLGRVHLSGLEQFVDRVTDDIFSVVKAFGSLKFSVERPIKMLDLEAPLLCLSSDAHDCGSTSPTAPDLWADLAGGAVQGLPRERRHTVRRTLRNSAASPGIHTQGLSRTLHTAESVRLQRIEACLSRLSRMSCSHHMAHSH